MRTSHLHMVLAEIPTGWTTEPLNKLLNASIAGAWGEEAGSDPVQVLRSTNFTESGMLDFKQPAIRFFPAQVAQKLAPKSGDLLLEKSGGGPNQPVGRLAFVREDLDGFAFSNFVQLLRPNPYEVESHYLGWMLHWINKNGVVERFQNQTTQMRNLALRDYLKLQIPLPSRAEQIAIARILNAADEAITRAQTALERAQTLKRGVLQTLLSCGVDETGHIRNPHTQPELFQKTPQGVFPLSWKIERLDSVADIGSGVTLGRKLEGVATVEIPYLRVANVQDGFLDLKEIKNVRVREDEIEQFSLEKGDVLLTEGGDFDKLGRGGVWEGDFVPCLHQNHIFRVRPDKHALSSHYLSLLVGSSYGKRYFMRIAKRTTNLASINKTQLRAFRVPLPEPDEQLKIVALSDAAQKNIEAVQNQLQLLQTLKRGLMQDLLTGRVRVPMVEMES